MGVGGSSDEHQEFIDAVADLVRGDLSQLESCIVFGEASSIGETAARFRCHYIRSDPNGIPRLNALAKQLARLAVFHCIPRRTIDAVRDEPDFYQQQLMSNDNAREARRLFTKNQPKSGEGGELLLYALLEHGLGVPQILSKMAMKSNENVQYQGTDGIHAKILENGNLALYWGEAKIWKSLSAALTDCFRSITPFLLRQSEDQDVWLIKQYADLGDRDLKDRVLRYFDDSQPESANVEIRGACLVGFSVDQYPNLPEDEAALKATMATQVETWKAQVAKRIKKNSVNSFQIEVFFLPLPDADVFRTAILEAVAK